MEVGDKLVFQWKQQSVVETRALAVEKWVVCTCWVCLKVSTICRKLPGFRHWLEGVALKRSKRESLAVGLNWCGYCRLLIGRGLLRG